MSGHPLEGAAVLLGVFQRGLEDEHGHGVVVAGVGLAAQAQGLQGDGAAAGEGVKDARGRHAAGLDVLHGHGTAQFAGQARRVGLVDVATGLLQDVGVEGVLPLAQLHDKLALLLPLLRIGGRRHQRGVGRGARGGQRPPCPPDVQCADMPVADVLLPGGFGADLADGEGLLDETAVGGHGASSPFSSSWMARKTASNRVR